MECQAISADKTVPNRRQIQLFFFFGCCFRELLDEGSNTWCSWLWSNLLRSLQIVNIHFALAYTVSGGGGGAGVGGCCCCGRLGVILCLPGNWSQHWRQQRRRGGDDDSERGETLMQKQPPAPPIFLYAQRNSFLGERNRARAVVHYGTASA